MGSKTPGPVFEPSADAFAPPHSAHAARIFPRPPRHAGDTLAMTTPTSLPPRYLRTSEAARFVGLSGRTLEKHRCYGTGPTYSKIGGRVVYRIEDLQTWVQRGATQSTSDTTTDPVRPAKPHAATAPAYRGSAR